jgi:hypothetical protein
MGDSSRAGLSWVDIRRLARIVSGDDGRGPIRDGDTFTAMTDRTRNIIKSVLRYLTVALLALWIGGFTLYATVVVRAGEAVIGGLKQGYVTQRVTDSINVIAIVCIVFVVIDLIVYRPHLDRWTFRARLAGVLVLIASLTLLYLFHGRMDALLDVETFKRPDRGAFRPLHQVYQLTATFMWLAFMAELGLMLRSHRLEAAAKTP